MPCHAVRQLHSVLHTRWLAAIGRACLPSPTLPQVFAENPEALCTEIVLQVRTCMCHLSPARAWLHTQQCTPQCRCPRCLLLQYPIPVYA